MVLVACAALVSSAPSKSSGQTSLTRQQKADLIDREVAYLDALLEKSRGDYLITFALAGSDPKTFLDAALAATTSSEPLVLVSVPKQVIVDQITRMALVGQLTARGAAEAAARAGRVSDSAVQAIRARLKALKAEKEALLKPPGGQTGVAPPGGGPRPQGHWRLKGGYPRFTEKDFSVPTARIALDVGSEQMVLERTDTGSGGVVLHAWTMECRYAGLGKAAFDAGEEVSFVLSGTFTLSKDSGGYQAVYPTLAVSSNVTILKAEPRRQGKYGPFSVSDSASLRLGRPTTGVLHEADRRDITFRVPKSGSEFSFNLGVAPYAGKMVEWVYEWVPQ
jgi:hypothetical protein